MNMTIFQYVTIIAASIMLCIMLGIPLSLLIPPSLWDYTLIPFLLIATVFYVFKSLIYIKNNQGISMSDKQTPNDFIKNYAKISDMDTTEVILLLEIQDKQCTKYSRVKTCLELWNARDTDINELKEEIELLKEGMRQFRIIANDDFKAREIISKYFPVSILNGDKDE